MIVWSTKTRAGKDTQKYTLTYDAESGRLEQMGEFEDVENVAKIITDKSTRQKIRQKFESGDKTPMNAVPSEQFSAEPPVEISMQAGSYVDDVFTSNRDSFMDND
jgi:hypothetical protein